MSTWALLSAAQLLAAPPVAGWSDLPVFPLPPAPCPVPRAAIAADASMFVKAEVDAGRCRTPDGRSLDAPVAILVGTAGMVRQIVPQAIGCPTVEQFTVGYLLSLTRGGPGSAQLPRAGWYSLTVGYRW